jgi:hypothetical protein
VLHAYVYGTGRFCFEFARGDRGRRYVWGFSEAQWTSLFLMGAVVWAELAGILVFHHWHTGITVFLVFTMIAVALKRRFQTSLGRNRLMAALAQSPHISDVQ